ncbi:MAG: hypothetical protein KAY22_05615 [Rhizorhabdus sp.]|uniref:hypothetical protein n=1 Tax=Rhizorhabdus sp. TaxID=1968843 RepID=UPI001B54A7C4|nr:hypothetical protein [Rhizorhabdus sp.]MBP8231763.1 hypothetical protein [Rhizorhabdus sp.]
MAAVLYMARQELGRPARVYAFTPSGEDQSFYPGAVRQFIPLARDDAAEKWRVSSRCGRPGVVAIGHDAEAALALLRSSQKAFERLRGALAYLGVGYPDAWRD